MPGWELIVGCVGKPSAGKSTFFNAVTDGSAKVGNYPFTTIEPNTGITYYMTDCPCKTKGLSKECHPLYGFCKDGQRQIPLKLLDVAGLIPGASEGAGLGNKFLDDLRHAHVLVHIVDVSGRTNEKGENTVGYDPSRDIDWLYDEIHAWIFNNIYKKWSGIIRKYSTFCNSEKPKGLAELLQLQLSGYGTTPSQSAAIVRYLNLKEPVDLNSWSADDVHRLVDAFMYIRFPIVVALNKADCKGKTDDNILKIMKRYNKDNVDWKSRDHLKVRDIVVISAASECFLKKLAAQKYITYNRGDTMFLTREDEMEATGKSKLKKIDATVSDRLEKIMDMVLFRYGSTGVWNVVTSAVKCMNPTIVYPVTSMTTYKGPRGGVFSTCYVLHQHATVEDLRMLLVNAENIPCVSIEAADGRVMGEEDEIENNSIVKINTRSNVDFSVCYIKGVSSTSLY